MRRFDVRPQARLRHLCRRCARRLAVPALLLAPQRALQLLAPRLALQQLAAQRAGGLCSRLCLLPRRLHLRGRPRGIAQLSCQLAATRLGGLAARLGRTLLRRCTVGCLLVCHLFDAQHLAARAELRLCLLCTLPCLCQLLLPLYLGLAQACLHRRLVAASCTERLAQLLLQAPHGGVLLQEATAARSKGNAGPA